MTHEFKSITLRGFVLLLLLLLAGGIYGIYQVHAAHDQLEQIVSINNRKIALATEMQVAGYRRQSFIYNMLLVTDPFELDAMFMAMNRETYVVGNSRNMLRDMGMGAAERAIFDRQSELVERVSEAQNRVIEQAYSGERERAWQLMLNEALPATVLANQTFQEMRELQTRITSEVVAAANRSYHETLWLTALLSLMGLLVGSLVATLAYRRTAHHARNMNANLSALADSFTQMEERAKSDPLTRLPNRVALIDYLERLCAQRRAQGGEYAVMFFDLDNFKPVNDRLGHDAGDELLVKVADRVKQVLRRGDMLARLGGDEFVVVLALEEAGEMSGQIAGKIIKALTRPFSLESGAVTIGASVGIALCPQDGGEAEQLLKRADEAMYRAKRAGRNRYHHFAGDGEGLLLNPAT